MSAIAQSISCSNLAGGLSKIKPNSEFDRAKARIDRLEADPTTVEPIS
jgi:hypothetical protein